MAGSLGLKDLMRAVQQDLPITMRHERWLLSNSNPTYSKEAVEFAAAVLAGEIGGMRARKPGWRASGMGRCYRERIFKRVIPHMEKEQVDSRTANIFHTGNFTHLKYQMAGLTEGWLTAAEVAYHSDEIGMGGTADGEVYDGSLYEVKSINKRGYDYVMKNGPKWEHKLQTGAYKLLNPALKAVSILYENKDTGEWREYREYFDDEVMEAVTDEIDVLDTAMRDKKLPPMLRDCVNETGFVFRGCPFREICPKTKNWPRGATT